MEKENKSVWSQEKEVQEDISETVEENTAEVKENVEETATEVQEVAELAEEKVDTVAEEIEEVKEEVIVPVKNMKKHDQAKLLVEQANAIVHEAEGQLEKCKLLLSDDLKGYDDAKKALKEGGLDESEALLLVLGYTDNTEDAIEEDSVVFEPKEDLEPIRLQDVSSGKFTGFLYSLIGGGLTLAGLVYYATNKLGMTLDVSKVPSNETLQTIFGWFGTQIGRPDDATNGALVVGAAVVAVMGIIYAIRVSTKGNKNLNFATQQLEEAEAYTAHKGNCKEEMDKVDAHIHDAITTLSTYQVLLNEQKGKLQRILYIEGEKEALSEYHEKSIAEMRETQGLINSIRSFMSTPMSEEGKLSGKSTLFLHSAKSKMQKVIEGLY